MNKKIVTFVGIAALVPMALVAQQELAKPGNTAVSGSSPLADYPEFGHDVASERRAFAADEAKRQNLIVQCMRDAGYSYRPVTGMIVQAKTGNLVSNEKRQARPKDPNESYVATLSAEELTSYNLALYGIPDPNDQANLWDPSSETGGGCWGDAMRAVPGVFGAQRELNASLVAMRSSIRNDGRIKSAESKWASCVKGQGFNIDSVAEYRAALSNGGDIRGKAAIDVEQLAALDQAGRTCMAERDYAQVVQSVTAEKEAAFVAQNRDVLDRHKYRPSN